MPLAGLDAVKREAASRLAEDNFKAAVEHEKKRLKEAKTHFFPKKIRFQWPVLFVEHHQPLNRRKSDKGRTQ